MPAVLKQDACRLAQFRCFEFDGLRYDGLLGLRRADFEHGSWVCNTAMNASKSSHVQHIERETADNGQSEIDEHQRKEGGRDLDSGFREGGCKTIAAQMIDQIVRKTRRPTGHYSRPDRTHGFEMRPAIARRSVSMRPAGQHRNEPGARA